MKLTTLLHLVDPKLFGKLNFRAAVLSYLPLFLYLMVVAMGLEWFAVHQNFTVALVLTAFIFGLMPLSIAQKITHPKVLQKHNLGFFDRRRMIEFDEEGMLIRYETGSYSVTKWTDIYKAESKSGAIRIFPSPAMCHLIPDTAWPSPQRTEPVDRTSSPEILTKIAHPSHTVSCNIQM